MDIYQLVVYVPATHVESVKEALFNAGAGRYKGYDRCSWQVVGKGQFRALDGSEPYTGEINELCELEEVRLEMMITDTALKAAITALVQSHPFEVPAYHLLKHHNPD